MKNHMALICFDIDGTIEVLGEESEYVNGPVKLSSIRYLSEGGNIVVMVSPSPYSPKRNDGGEVYFKCAEYGSNDMRHKNLLDAVEQYGEHHQLRLYVSNNGDYKEAIKAGFIYVDAKMFAGGFDEEI